MVVRSPDNAARPFAVQNLLPAGTLSLPISQKDLANVCDHTHTTEDWHTFPGKALLPYLTDQESETLCRHLDFLVEHQFIIIQCKVGDSRAALILRVYIVPYDLPGVQGMLRVRDETSVLKPARLCLRNVMPQIIQERSLWDGHDLDPSPSSPSYFLDSKTVVVLSFTFRPDTYQLKLGQPYLARDLQ
jgi:hypothetical protein